MGGDEEPQKGGNNKPIYFRVLICDEKEYDGFIMIGHPVGKWRNKRI